MSKRKERGKGNGKRGGAGQEDRARAREEQEIEEGASSPFYSESGIPGCCWVTVGQNLDIVLTVSKFFSLVKILPLCLAPLK